MLKYSVADIEEVKLFYDVNVTTQFNSGLKFKRFTPERDQYHNEIIGHIKGTEVSINDLGVLLPQQWLNDTVIDFVLDLICCSANEKGHSIHYLSSTWYLKMQRNEGMDGMKRFGRKEEYHKKDKILVPINLDNLHWVLVVVDFSKKELRYYDSFQYNGKKYCQAVQAFFAQYIVLYGGNSNIVVSD